MRASHITWFCFCCGPLRFPSRPPAPSRPQQLLAGKYDCQRMSTVGSPVRGRAPCPPHPDPAHTSRPILEDVQGPRRPVSCRPHVLVEVEAVRGVSGAWSPSQSGHMLCVLFLELCAQFSCLQTGSGMLGEGRGGTRSCGISSKQFFGKSAKSLP